MKYALVTGAAKGIGKAIAAELAARDYNLLIVDLDDKGLAKTKDEFDTTFRVNTNILQLDLSSPNCAEEIKEWSKPYHPYLNVIINNAGYGLNGAFEQMSIDEQLNIIDVNVKAQVKICHAFIPLLRQFPEAWIMNVGSTTSYQSVPYLALYSASKALVISFTRSLRYELRNSPISVSVLSPGSTDTNFVDRARMGEKIRKVATRYNMTPQQVAKIAVKGLFKRKAEIIPGFTNKLNAFLPKFFPKSFVERIAANIYEPPANDEPVKVEALA